MTTEYRTRQEAQLKKFLAWREAQGGLELPVTLHTLLRPEQQARIAWIVQHATGRVLEVGTSWGYVLARIRTEKPGDHTGIDITEWNVDLAKTLCPDLNFLVGDARELRFANRSYDTVLLAEILEHLSWPAEVHQAIREACRVSRDTILVTVPDGDQDSSEATSKKHQYLLDKPHQDELATMIWQQGFAVAVMNIGPFLCWKAVRE